MAVHCCRHRMRFLWLLGFILLFRVLHWYSHQSLKASNCRYRRVFRFRISLLKHSVIGWFPSTTLVSKISLFSYWVPKFDSFCRLRLILSWVFTAKVYYISEIHFQLEDWVFNLGDLDKWAMIVKMTLKFCFSSYLFRKLAKRRFLLLFISYLNLFYLFSCSLFIAFYSFDSSGFELINWFSACWSV